MNKYEVKETVTLTVEKGSVVIVSDDQANYVKDKIKAIKEPKKDK